MGYKTSFGVLHCVGHSIKTMLHEARYIYIYMHKFRAASEAPCTRSKIPGVR